MRMAPSVKIDHRQSVGTQVRQHISPSAIHGLEVLSLPVARLGAYLSEAVECNPLLDYDYDRAALTFEELPQEQDTAETEDMEEAAGFISAAGGFLPPRSAATSTSEGFDWSRFKASGSDVDTLQSSIRMQLGTVPLSDDDKALLAEVLEGVDDAGYFTGSLKAICAACDRSMFDGERILSLVQSCSPRGVGARSVVECLLLQLSDDMPFSDVVRSILAEDIEDLAENRTTRLMRKYHIDLDDLAVIRKVVSELNPRPGSSFSSRNDTPYVIPDISIRRQGKGFGVHVTGEIGEAVILNKEYCSFLEGERLDSEAREWLEEKKEEARSVLSNVEQRHRTLQRFGEYLVEAQYDFFCQGPSCMRPLTMQQVADSLGVHVSTISRTVQDKYALTPWGVIGLKQFFSSAVTCSPDTGAESMSSVAIKGRIKEIVDREDHRNPLSDSAITELLNDEGIEIKRRTVAKYREAIGLGRQSQRRR